MSVTRRGFLTAASVGMGAAVASSMRLPLAGANPLETGSLAGGTGSAGILQEALQAVPTGSGMIQPRGPLGYVGVTFPTVEQIAGRIRFGFPDGSLGDWIPLQPHDSAPDTGGRPGAELVTAPDGAVRYEVQAPEGSHATAFDDGRGPREYSLGPGSGDPLGSLTGSLPAAGLNLPIIPRHIWGAGDPAGNLWGPAVFHPAQAITIHHTAVVPGADRAAALRSIYNYHTHTLGWGDIGYHLIIDPEGRIYQGRGGTIGGNPVFRTPPVVGPAQVVTGGHVGGFNNGNIGISLLGDFTGRGPTEAAIRSTIDCVRSLSGIVGLHPHSGITYRNPDGGATRSMPFVSGHREWGGTACPGNAFFPMMPFIRDHAANGWNPRPLALSPFGS